MLAGVDDARLRAGEPVGLTGRDEAEAVLAEAPVLLVHRVFAGVVREHEVESRGGGTGSFLVGCEILGTHAAEATPKQPAAFPAEAPIGLVGGVFGKILPESEVESLQAGTCPCLVGCAVLGSIHRRSAGPKTGRCICRRSASRSDDVRPRRG